MSDSKITCPQCGAWLNIHPGGSCSSCGWERPVTTAGQTYDRDGLTHGRRRHADPGPTRPMTDRDALAALIERTQYGDEALPTPSSYGYALADAILAAGWRAPREGAVFEPIDPMDDEYDRTEVWVRGRLRNNMGAPNVTLAEADHPKPVEAWMRHQDPREEPHYYRKHG